MHKSVHFALSTSGLCSRTVILKSALLFVYSLTSSISCSESQVLLMPQNLLHPSFANVFFKGRLACLKITLPHNEETSESLLAQKRATHIHSFMHIPLTRWQCFVTRISTPLSLKLSGTVCEAGIKGGTSLMTPSQLVRDKVVPSHLSRKPHYFEPKASWFNFLLELIPYKYELFLI